MSRSLPPVSLLDSSSWCLSLPWWWPSRLAHPFIFQLTFNCSGIMFLACLTAWIWNYTPSTKQHIPIGYEAMHQKKIFEWIWMNRTWSWMKPSKLIRFMDAHWGKGLVWRLPPFAWHREGNCLRTSTRCGWNWKPFTIKSQQLSLFQKYVFFLWAWRIIPSGQKKTSRNT